MLASLSVAVVGAHGVSGRLIRRDVQGATRPETDSAVAAAVASLVRVAARPPPYFEFRDDCKEDPWWKPNSKVLRIRQVCAPFQMGKLWHCGLLIETVDPNWAFCDVGRLNNKHGYLECMCDQGAWSPADAPKEAKIDDAHQPLAHFGTVGVVWKQMEAWTRSKKGYAMFGGYGRRTEAANCQTFVRDLMLECAGVIVKPRQHRLMKVGGRIMKASDRKRRDKIDDK